MDNFITQQEKDLYNDLKRVVNEVDEIPEFTDEIVKGSLRYLRSISKDLKEKYQIKNANE